MKHAAPTTRDAPSAHITELATQVFSGNDPLLVAAQIALARHTLRLWQHEAGVRAGEHHAVHQMRVATRRLRATSSATKAALAPDVTMKLNKRLRSLARALGQVRDLDVEALFLDTLPADQPAFQTRRTAIAAARADAHAALVRELDHQRTHKLARLLEAVLNDSGNRSEPVLLVRHAAGSTIWDAYEHLLRYETVITNASAEQLHDLRIVAKRLRYTLDLFAPALGDSSRSLIRNVAQLQDILGAIHDADVVLERTDDNTIPAAYRAAREAQRNTDVARIGPAWTQLTKNRSRQRLARLITDL